MNNKREHARDIYNSCKTHGEIIDKIQEALESRDTIAALRSQLTTVTAEREALFDIAVKATRCIDEMGFIAIKGKAKELDHALATLPPELWERVDDAALNGGKV